MQYQPHLDGLRGLAALTIVAFHARVPGLWGGFIAVDVFFVLSGYLITKVLKENHSIGEFYYRRVTRLVPPLVLMLITYLAVFTLLMSDYPHWRDAIISFLYLSDYSAAFWGIPKYLLHTWSLSVEAYFYILWPLVFVLFKPGVPTLFLFYIVVTAWRWVQPEWSETYYRFDTRVSGLILGCVLAYFPNKLKVPGLLGLPLIALGCHMFMLGEPTVQDWGMIVIEISTAIVLIGKPPQFLMNNVLIYLGKLSYGIYLWHYPVVRLLREQGIDWSWVFVGGLGVSILCAAFSYHIWEPYVRRKMSWGRSRN